MLYNLLKGSHVTAWRQPEFGNRESSLDENFFDDLFDPGGVFLLDHPAKVFVALDWEPMVVAAEAAAATPRLLQQQG